MNIRGNQKEKMVTLTLVLMKSLIIYKSGAAQIIPRRPMLKETVIKERSSKVGYQNKLRLLQ